MRTKLFEHQGAAGAGTASATFYWPIDTHLYPNFSVAFNKTAGAGQATAVSASFTQYPVLSRGVACATWTKITSGAISTFNVNVQDAVSCFRFTVHTSGAGTFAFAANQAGSEYR